MKLRLTNLLVFIFLVTNAFCQEKYTVITGKIFSFNNAVSNVNIINLNNSSGTISNDNGEFEIRVHLNDTLLFSSIQYEKIKIAITKNHLNSKIIDIQLIPLVNQLKEVFLYGLSGNLTVDLNKTPKDTIPNHSFKYNISDLDKKLPGDEYGYLTKPNAESFSNPLYLANGGQGSKFDKRLEAKRKLKRNINKKIQFPILIKKELGISYFTKTLKITEEKIDHFLAYCEYKNIIEAYNKNNLLEVIKILREESKTYNEIKN